MVLWPQTSTPDQYRTIECPVHALSATAQMRGVHSLKCYTFDGKPPEEQWSKMPPNTTQGVSWFGYSGRMQFR